MNHFITCQAVNVTEYRSVHFISILLSDGYSGVATRTKAVGIKYGEGAKFIGYFIVLLDITYIQSNSNNLTCK